MNFSRLLIGLLSLAMAACSGTQVLNSLADSRDTTQASNVVYDAATDGRVDIYSPSNLRNAPVVVFFHGGRWSSGSKEDYEYVGRALAAKGYVAMIPEVRQYPVVRFPAFVEDGARAVKWAYEHAEQYSGSPRKLFVMGHSSGAHIAAMLALNEDYLKKIDGSRDWIKGMIGLAGAYDFMPITDPELRAIFGPPEEFEKSQPIYFVDGRNPPLLLVHGEDDEVVAVRNTRNLAHVVKSANGPVETVIYLKLSNDMAVKVLAPSLQSRADVMASIVEFINGTLEHPQPNSGVAGEAFDMPPEPPEAHEVIPDDSTQAPVPVKPEDNAPTSGFEIVTPPPQPQPQP